MKTVMIPTNFTGEGIHVAEAILRDMNDEVKIVYTHLFHVAEDIQDLLFSGSREKEYELVPREFWAECQAMKESFSQKLRSIRIDFFYGNKLAALKNFMEYHDVAFIAYSEQLGIPKLTKNSLDALPILQKAGVPIVNVDLTNASALSATVDVH
jgi:hypothetical protein